MDQNSPLGKSGKLIVDTFGKQCKIYSELEALARSISGKIAVTKGDFSSIIPSIKKKQELLSQIDNLKSDASESILFWQENRESASQEISDSVHTALDQIESAIKKFLVIEKQVQKQIFFYQK